MTILEHPQIPAEYVDLYTRKTGDADLDNLPNLTVIPDRGFTSWVWRESDETIFSVSTAGDGKFWECYYLELAMRLGAKRILFPTVRNPRGFVRRFRCRVAGYIMERSFEGLSDGK